MSNQLEPDLPSWRRELPVALLVAALFLLSILVSSQLETAAHPISVIRVGGAIVLGTMLRRRPSAPAIHILLTLIAAVAANMLAGRPMSFSVGAGAIRAGEIALAYGILHRMGIRPEGLLDVRALAYTGAVAVGAVPLLGGIAGGLLIYGFYGTPLLEGIASWAFGNAMGMLVLLPVMLAWTPERWSRMWRRHRLRTFVILTLATLTVTVLALKFSARPFILISLPLILVSLRLGLLATTIVCALNTSAIWLVRGMSLQAWLTLGATDHLAALGTTELNIYSAATVLAPLTISVILVDRMRGGYLLAESQRMLQTVTDNVPALIGYLDRDRRYRFVNRVYKDWFGMDASRFEGRTVHEIFGEEAARGYDAMIDRAMAGELVHFERTLPGGRQIESSLIPDLDEETVRGIYLMSSDISARKALEESLRLENQRVQDLAQRDHLTGLPNRMALDIHLGQALDQAQRTGSPMAVLFMDLDGFKQINDTLGHDFGDRLLQRVAARLAASVRTTDTLARLGGDEFVVVLPRIRISADAVQIVDKLHSAMREPIRIDGQQIPVTLSIGLALYPDDGDDGPSLMKHADAAMYRAKMQGGRNRPPRP